jgi:hypothetical protein
LQEFDRKGERGIAVVQGAVAVLVLLLHIISAANNDWQTFNIATALIAASIIVASLARVRLSDDIQRSRWRPDLCPDHFLQLGI